MIEYFYVILLFGFLNLAHPIITYEEGKKGKLRVWFVSEEGFVYFIFLRNIECFFGVNMMMSMRKRKQNKRG